MFTTIRQLERWVTWMRVSELFDYANKNDFTDLQALIMFLAFEKKVLNMDDDTSELDLYFLEKHSSRMNKELHSYKKKMNMGYKPDVYMVKTEKGTIYVYAHSEVEAKTVVNKRLMKVSEVKVCYMDDLMNLNGRNMTFRTIVQDKNAPEILGGFSK